MTALQVNNVPFPQVPNFHPSELLQAMKEGVPQFDCKRGVEICATHDLLSKHVQQLSSIDTNIS